MQKNIKKKTTKYKTYCNKQHKITHMVYVESINMQQQQHRNYIKYDFVLN